MRQLQNVLFRAAVLCEGNALAAADFPHIARESSFSKRADDYHARPLNGASAAAAMIGTAVITIYASDVNLRALQEGFTVIVDSTAVRGVDVEPGDSERALEQVREAGASVA